MKKNRLYNVIFPIWLLIFLPPIVLIIIPANFIIDFIVLYIISKSIHLLNIKEIIKKDYLKVVGFGFLADIIGGLLLFITIFIDPLNDMAWNPYKSPLTTIYLLIAFGISTYLIYFFNNKYNFKKTVKDKVKIKKISILLALTTAPYLFLVPTSLMYKNPITITNYYNTDITVNTKVDKIKSFLKNNPYIDKYEVDKNSFSVTITLKESDEYYNFYKDLEEDASLLFKTIKKLNNVIFIVNGEKYNFDYNHINKIYNNNIKSNDYSVIYKRYSNENFENAIYMGNIDGKYDLFDKSENCSTNIVKIYEDEHNNYSISCNEIDKLYIILDEKEINIKNALEEGMFNINSLSTTTLKIYKEGK